MPCLIANPSTNSARCYEQLSPVEDWDNRGRVGCNGKTYPMLQTAHGMSNRGGG